LQDRRDLGAIVGGVPTVEQAEMNALQAKLDKLREDAAWWKMYADTVKEAGFTPEGAPLPGRGPSLDTNPQIPGAGHSVGTFSAAAIAGMIGGIDPIDKLRQVAEQQLEEQRATRRAIEESFEWA
jgi:hypothetical protein